MPALPDGRPAPGIPAQQADLGALAALGEPARRALYAYVAAQGRPVSRDEAAGATGMRRATAAFHLERLVEDGLLEAGFARLSGRTGPGAGRTAKLYSRAHRQIDVSLPPRRYAVAGDILACAVEEAQRRSAPVGEAVTQAAERAGRQMAAGAADLADMLASLGYEPRDAGPGETQLANCPFHELASAPPRARLHAEPAPAPRGPGRAGRARPGTARPGRRPVLRDDHPRWGRNRPPLTPAQPDGGPGPIARAHGSAVARAAAGSGAARERR